MLFSNLKISYKKSKNEISYLTILQVDCWKIKHKKKGKKTNKVTCSG